jgi:hypothetical protein
MLFWYKSGRGVHYIIVGVKGAMHNKYFNTGIEFLSVGKTFYSTVVELVMRSAEALTRERTLAA